MTGPARPGFPFDLPALVARLAARNAARRAKRVQRAEHRARLLARSTANYRRFCGGLGSIQAGSGHPRGCAPVPPGGGFLNRRDPEGYSDAHRSAPPRCTPPEV